MFNPMRSIKTQTTTMETILISNSVTLPESEITLSPIRAQGSGGQNVNKVSSAIHLRFNIQNSSLPDFYKERLLALSDSRITEDGVIIIKAQNHRSQQKNRDEAITRLVTLIKSVSRIQKTRKPTKPSRSAKSKRTDSKTKRGQLKSLRKKVTKY